MTTSFKYQRLAFGLLCREDTQGDRPAPADRPLTDWIQEPVCAGCWLTLADVGAVWLFDGASFAALPNDEISLLGEAQTLALTCAPRGCHCPEKEVPEFPHIAAVCWLPSPSHKNSRNDGFLPPPSGVESIPSTISAPHRQQFGVFSQGYGTDAWLHRILSGYNTWFKARGRWSIPTRCFAPNEQSSRQPICLGGCQRLNNRSSQCARRYPFALSSARSGRPANVDAGSRAARTDPTQKSTSKYD